MKSYPPKDLDEKRIKSNSTEENSLKQILSGFANEYKSDPYLLLKSINGEDICRFFIDGVHQQNQGMNKAVSAYESREQGFYLSSGMAFCFMLDEAKKNNEFTDMGLLGFIKKLHEKVLSKISFGTNYHKHCELASHENCYKKHLKEIAEFRAIDLMIINIGKQTEEGIREALEQITKGNHPWLQLKVIEYHSYEEKVTIYDMKTLKSSQQSIPELANKIFKCFENDAKGFKNDFKLQLLSVIPEKNVIKKLDEHALKIIKKFRQDFLSSHNVIDKISCIVEFIKDMEQLHPFVDGNGRTFVTLLLNYLLIVNKLPPVILEDPNNFDHGSKEQLLKQVIEGMNNSINLAKDKKLFGSTVLDIKNIPSFLLQHNFYHVLNLSKNYFYCAMDEKSCKTAEESAKINYDAKVELELKAEAAVTLRYKKILSNIEQYAVKKEWSIRLFGGKKYQLDEKHSIKLPTKIYTQLEHLQIAKQREKEGKRVDWKDVFEMVIFSGNLNYIESKNKDNGRIEYHSLFKPGNEEKLYAAFGIEEKEDKEAAAKQLHHKCS